MSSQAPAPQPGSLGGAACNFPCAFFLFCFAPLTPSAERLPLAYDLIFLYP